MPPNLFRRAMALLPTSPSSQLFLAMTALETVVDVCIVAILLNSFEGKILSTVLERNEDSVLPVYLGLFVLAHLVQLVLAFDAIIAKNTIQVVALVVFNTLFLVYSIIQILEIKDLLETGTLRILVWLIPVMISLTEATYIGTFYWVYRDFGWQVFKKIGADRSIKRIYAMYQVFLCILKFDVFFFIAFSLQLVLLVLQQNDLERYLTVAALPITLLILIMGYFAIRREIRSLFWVFLLGCVAGACYFVYKLILIYRNRETDYVLVYKSLTVFAALCFATLLGTAVTSFICYRNFGRGLRYHRNTDKTRRRRRL
ncbi:hypothetical protein BCR35DRAFT_203909 [Leucosporidium creatinivorum]|uniref:Uncharacterized protein n=1 Tax=Leucosporidium creatinivorum TaxID=106004 RepID=A0A1Y2DGF9_9BASI|nr:hypothetical protein BCR35DRAFT_203909 [Leucosporidium creatinivorum]